MAKSPIKTTVSSRHRQRGVTSIEYSLLGVLIAVAIIASVSNTGSEVARFYQYVAGLVGCAASGGPC